MTYYNYIRLRRAALAIVWLMAVVSLFLPGMKSIFFLDPYPTTYPTIMWVLRHLFGALGGWADANTRIHDPTRYYFTIISSIAGAMSHCYFILTPCIIFMVRPTWIGRIIRGLSFTLLFVWLTPILNRIHPLDPHMKIENGYHLLGASYTIAMMVIMFCPGPPKVERAFPVVVENESL